MPGMHVVATAGHVDHGKSTLVRALTGRDPDRLDEEHRRGLTIELGYAWTTLPSGRRLALVDVPGHQRFVPTMLAGVGLVPAVLFVVAADEGWRQQSAEHLEALSAFGVQQALLVITRSDLADPEPAAQQALAELEGTSLGRPRWLAVSGTTGIGLAALRQGLDDLCAVLPSPDTVADVRLWVDRSFVVRGAGTVVTGTLGAGSIAVGDELELLPGGRRLRVRGIQTLEQQVEQISGTARVALNLRGVDAADVPRGCALVSPGGYVEATRLDVRLRRTADDELPAEMVLHIGSTHRAVHVRPLGTDAARLTMSEPLPVHLGDRAVLRDPGRHRVLAGVTVLDVDPPGLTRRGAPAARGTELAARSPTIDADAEIARRGIVHAGVLRALGVVPSSTPLPGGWHVAAGYTEEHRIRCAATLSAYGREHPLEPGMPVDALTHSLGLPDARLLPALLPEGADLSEGRVATGGAVPVAVRAALRELDAVWQQSPWRAPDSDRLGALGLGRRELAAAVRAGALLEVAPGVCIGAGADVAALDLLRGLPQPFTVSDARRVLDTSRRVAVPLLELLDRQGRTRRLPDDRRTVA